MEANNFFTNTELLATEFNASIDTSTEQIDMTAVEGEDSSTNMTSVWLSTESFHTIEAPRKDNSISSENLYNISAISVDDFTIVSDLDEFISNKDVRHEPFIDLPPIRIKETRKKRYFTDQTLNSTFTLSPCTNLSDEIKNNDLKNLFRKSKLFGSLSNESETKITRNTVAKQIDEMNAAPISHMESPNHKQQKRMSKLIRSSTLNSVTPLRMNADVASPEVSVINDGNDTLISDVNVEQETVRNSTSEDSKEEEEGSQLVSISLSEFLSKTNTGASKQHVTRRCSALKDFVRKKWKSFRKLGKYHGSYLAMKTRQRALTDVKMIRCDSKVLCLAATKPNQFPANKRSNLKDGASLFGMLRLNIECSEHSLDLKVISGFDMHLNPNFTPDTFVQMSLVSCTNEAEYTWRSPVEHHRTNPKYNKSYSIDITPQDYRSRLVLTVCQLTDDPLLDIFIGRMSFNVSSLLFKNTSGYYKLLPIEIDLVKNIKVAEDHEFRKITLKRGEENRKNLGFVLVKFQSCFVEFVKTDSLASEAGMMAGDEIVQIDGVSCMHWEVEKIIEHLRNSKTSIHLIIRRRPCNYYNNSNYDDLDVSYFKGEDL